jgi:hypothetical protein
MQMLRVLWQPGRILRFGHERNHNMLLHHFKHSSAIAKYMMLQHTSITSNTRWWIGAYLQDYLRQVQQLRLSRNPYDPDRSLRWIDSTHALPVQWPRRLPWWHLELAQPFRIPFIL